MTLADSVLLDAQTHEALRAVSAEQQELSQVFRDGLPFGTMASEEITALRKRQAEDFYRTSIYRKLRDRYAVDVTSRVIGEIYTEVFTPVQGIVPRNAQRVLINLHGGGFQGGSRVTSHLESVPIAAVSRTRVVSVDYRMAPEHGFPAATEDVVSVYRALLNDYKPQRIGIYGCSAGGVLTAQVIVQLQKQGLPSPGAVGMLFGAAAYWLEGDSGQINLCMTGSKPMSSQDDPYFRGADSNDPSVFPARSPALLARFPPSLLIAATRDMALSSVVHTHSLLTRAGVKADLHVWEGLGHAFHYHSDLPQSREVYEVIGRFFDARLSQ